MTVGRHCGATQHGTVRCPYGHGCACFAIACQGGAIGGDRQVGHGGRRRGVGCGVRCGRRHVAGCVGGGHLQRLAIGLGTVQGDLEGAVAAGYRCAQHVAAGIAHGHGAAGLGGTGQLQPGTGQGECCRCRRRGEVRRGDRHGGGSVVARVGLRNAQVLGVELSAAQGEGKAAIGRYQAGAYDGPVRAVNGDRGTGFAKASQGQAVVVQHHVGQRRGRGQVRGCHIDCRRGVAGGIHLRHADDLAVGLRRVEGHREATVCAHRGGAEQGT